MSFYSLIKNKKLKISLFFIVEISFLLALNSSKGMEDANFVEADQAKAATTLENPIPHPLPAAELGAAGVRPDQLAAATAEAGAVAAPQLTDSRSG